MVSKSDIAPGTIVRIPWGVSQIDGLVLDVYGRGSDVRAVVRVPAALGYPDMAQEDIVVRISAIKAMTNTWPRDSYTGPGGGLYTGPGGGLYTGPGGGAYTGPGGGLYTGPGGGAYTGPGGGLSTGPGGGLFTGPGGGLYTGPGGGLYTGPGGGLYTGPGGGLYLGPTPTPYRSNWPTRASLLMALRESGLHQPAKVLREAWGTARQR